MKLRPADKILIVEGETDKRALEGLSRLLLGETAPHFSIEVRNGVSNILRTILDEISVEGREAVGILLDADANIGDRWKAIVSQVERLDSMLNTQSSGPNILSCPEAKGTIIDYSP